MDTIEGVRVALKLPHGDPVDGDVVEEFRREVRLMSRLDHPNILPLKDASWIEGRFVVVSLLGEETLADRLSRRLAGVTALSFAEQMIEATAHAHQHRIIHCDIKPENMILFPDHRLRLTDFGIAKVARRTIKASGSGTVGYLAPEQALGRPSFRSDVFSLGLVIYRVFSGRLPEWPFDWPPPGHDRLRRRVSPELIELLRQALQLSPKRRFADASRMLRAFKRCRVRALIPGERKRAADNNSDAARHWWEVRRRQFQRRHGRVLETRQDCRHCEGPLAETMRFCPWCGREHRPAAGTTRFPVECSRCRRGMKLDWRFCPWCWGPGYEPHGPRRYSDRRYQARCTNPGCKRKDLMPFMRYCPWCHTKVRRRWAAGEGSTSCGSCGWGVLPEFWSWCPWCGKRVGGGRSGIG
jgi:serine/threonine-protein kinase